MRAIVWHQLLLDCDLYLSDGTEVTLFIEDISYKTIDYRDDYIEGFDFFNQE